MSRMIVSPGAVKNLKEQVTQQNDAIAKLCVVGATISNIVSTDTSRTSTAVTGLTSKHRVLRWGFSVGDENNPPADITLTPSDNGTYTVAISNHGGTTFSMTPVFVLPQNV